MNDAPTSKQEKPPERIWMNPRHAGLYAQPEHMRDPHDTAEYVRADLVLADVWDAAIEIVRVSPILSDEIYNLPQGGTIAEVQIPFTAAGFKEGVIAALEAARDKALEQKGTKG